MAGPQRTPPRFVPTLTAIVDSPASVPGEPAEFTAADWSQLPSLEPAAGRPHEAPTAGPVHTGPVDTDDFRPQEQLLQRVMQRVDLTLEQRLGDAVSIAVRQQLAVMGPRLREEIEDVVRSVIADALAHAFAENTGSVPSQTDRSLG